MIEKELAPFHARPHWGKLFTTSPAELKRIYKKMPDFIELSRKYDPQGKFRNEYLNRNVFGKLAPDRVGNSKGEAAVAWVVEAMLRDFTTPGSSTNSGQVKLNLE